MPRATEQFAIGARDVPPIGSAFKIAAADQMLADGPRLFHSRASDLAQSAQAQAIGARAANAAAAEKSQNVEEIVIIGGVGVARKSLANLPLYLPRPRVAAIYDNSDGQSRRTPGEKLLLWSVMWRVGDDRRQQRFCSAIDNAIAQPRRRLLSAHIAGSLGLVPGTQLPIRNAAPKALVAALQKSQL